MTNTYKVTFAKIKEAEPVGIYKPTNVDAQKSAAGFRLLQAGPYMIRWGNGTTEKVSARQLRGLQKLHSWATDF